MFHIFNYGKIYYFTYQIITPKRENMRFLGESRETVQTLQTLKTRIQAHKGLDLPT